MTASQRFQCIPLAPRHFRGLQYPAKAGGALFRHRTTYLPLLTELGYCARKLKVPYPGAVYHVMNRGDRREPIYADDQDRLLFLNALAEACEKTTMTLEWIADRLCMGAATHVASLLQRRNQEGRNSEVTLF